MKLRLTNNRIPKLGKHIIAKYGTARRFRTTKRGDLKRAIAAVSALRTGCAYIPRGQEIVTLVYNALDELRVACSKQEWGQ